MLKYQHLELLIENVSSRNCIQEAEELGYAIDCYPEIPFLGSPCAVTYLCLCLNTCSHIDFNLSECLRPQKKPAEKAIFTVTLSAHSF